MSTDSPLTFRVAQQAGSPDKPSEDRVFLTPNASIVLDGASQWTPLEKSGGWIAEQLGRRLQQSLTADPSAELRTVLDNAVDFIIQLNQLKPGLAPSTTVNIVRASPGNIDVLVLGDSPVFVRECTGQIHEIRDDRLKAVTNSLSRPPYSTSRSDPALQGYIEEFESLRNAPDGFWCVSATPRVAEYAITAKFPRSKLKSFLAVTDGVSIGVDRYRRPNSWTLAFDLAEQDPRLIVEEVTSAEIADRDMIEWPRSKVHDDKSAVSASLQLDAPPLMESSDNLAQALCA